MSRFVGVSFNDIDGIFTFVIRFKQVPSIVVIGAIVREVQQASNSLWIPKEFVRAIGPKGELRPNERIERRNVYLKFNR